MNDNNLLIASGCVTLFIVWIASIFLYIPFAYFMAWLLITVVPSIGMWVVDFFNMLGYEITMEQIPSIAASLAFIRGFLMYQSIVTNNK